jgi:hypothetical protein
MIWAIVALIVLIVSCGNGFAQAPPSPIETKTGYANVLRVEQPFKSVLIGNPDMIDAHVLGDRELLVTAKDKAGRTNLILLDNANQEVYSADIIVKAPDPVYPRQVTFHTKRELNDYFVYTCTSQDCVRLKEEFPGQHSKDIFVPGLMPQQNFNVEQNASPNVEQSAPPSAPRE